MMMTDYQPLPNVPQIAYLASLARHIGIDLSLLERVSKNIESHWREGKREKKADGSIRITHSGTPELKRIHRHINKEILSKAYLPDYLFGGLKNLPDGTQRNHITNAKLHSGNRLIISADIANFFPSINESIIRKIWQHFFLFSPDVSELLTRLTSYKGELPQGWACSSYLAQLVFWDVEYELVHSFEKENIQYSRYIDDFTLSTNRTLQEEQITKLFSGLAFFCFQKGVRLKGRKCTVQSKGRRQTINKLVVNNNISIPPEYRRNLRAQIHQFVINKSRLNPKDYSREFSSIIGKINYLRNLHPKQSDVLRAMLFA